MTGTWGSRWRRFDDANQRISDRIYGWAWRYLTPVAALFMDAALALPAPRMLPAAVRAATKARRVVRERLLLRTVISSSDLQKGCSARHLGHTG